MKFCVMCNRYTNFRLKLHKIIKAAKKSYYHRKFDNVKGNIKKTWAKRGKKKSNIEASFLIDGNLVIDRRKISNEFNFFFSSIARKMNAKIHSSTLNSTHEESSGNFKNPLV